ncbi:MAG: hypothetical protein JNL73_07105 [Anaerolineales bacterium]|nr:hypothetical protein [Anaerolineales bacterium]
MSISPALWALLALAIAITLAAWRPGLNAGLLSVTFAALIGLYAAGLNLNKVAGFLPTQLILTLVAVAHFFEMARLNGALDRLAGAALSIARGRPAWLPVIFFGITLVFSAIGPGNIAATAMIAPIGMAVAARAGLNPLLMAIVICTGANAGAFSPIALTGLINVGLIHDIGVTDPTAGWTIFGAVAALQSISALAAYIVFGGYRSRQTTPLEIGDPIGPIGAGGPAGVSQPTDQAHLLTFGAMVILLVLVLFFNVPTAVAALLVATALALVGAGHAEEALRTLPWSVIVMVSGIMVLIGLVESTGGLDLATAAIASVSSPNTINTVMALITGIVSMFSSSSGVVLPTFIPLIPSLITQLGGGSVWKLIIAVDIGSHMVDVSPLSTLGALCLAALPPAIDKAPVFRGLLTWGFAMAVVAAVLAFVFLDLIPW